MSSSVNCFNWPDGREDHSSFDVILLCLSLRVVVSYTKTGRDGQSNV